MRIVYSGHGLSGLRRAYPAGFREVERINRAIGLVQHLITKALPTGLVADRAQLLGQHPLDGG